MHTVSPGMSVLKIFDDRVADFPIRGLDFGGISVHAVFAREHSFRIGDDRKALLILFIHPSIMRIFCLERESHS